MAAFEHPSFHYHAGAHALSGEYRRPVKQSIEALAGSSLPFIGGHGNGHVETVQIGHGVSLKKGYSHVSGTRGDNGKHNSLATAVVEGLNILDVLTADRIVARVTSEHEPSQREGHIIALGSAFHNLRVSGCPVEVEFDHQLLLKYKTHESLRKGLATLKNSGRMAEESHGVILCSLVKSIKVECPGVEVKGHVISVAHFGKIYVGELLAEPGYRSICMLRLEMGSPDDASLTIAGAFSNGRTWP